MLWLAILGRLSRKDRMQTWGIIDNSSCVLCSGGLESHSNLIFCCPSSSQVWEQLLGKNNISKRPDGLLRELDWICQHVKGRGMLQSIYKLSFAATVYYLWKERNAHIFQHKAEATEEVVQRMMSDLRRCISS